MAKVEKSVLVHFTAQQIFELVRDVEAYPSFLPWCSAAHRECLSDTQEKAGVEISFKGIKQSFTTLNTVELGKAIHLQLIDGPFKSLEGQWQFIALSETACKVVFSLEYDFSNRILEKLIGSVFNMIANSFVDNFIKQAERIHSSGESR